MKLAFATIILAAAVSFATAQEAPKKRVLLAWEDTNFKKELVDEMDRLLVQKGCDVKKVQHSKKGLDAKAADFDAVFITNSGVHSKVRPWITEWLTANKAQGSRIILHTTQTSNWKVKAEVDAVTSASAKNDVKTLAADYVARIEKLTAPPGAK